MVDDIPLGKCAENFERYAHPLRAAIEIFHLQEGRGTKELDELR